MHKTIGLSLLATVSAIMTAQPTHAAVGFYHQSPDFKVSLTNSNEATRLFPKDLILNVNNDNYTWYSNGAGYFYSYNSEDLTIGGDDWLVSKKIYVTPGHKYELALTAFCTYPSTPECIEAYIATHEVSQPADFDIEVVEPTEINISNSKNPAMLSGTFTCATASYIQIGIHEISSPDCGELYLTSIALTDLGEDPDIAEDALECHITVDTDTDGALTAGYEYPLTVSVTNNSDRELEDIAVDITSGNDEPTTYTLATLGLNSTQTINVLCHPSLFDTDTYTITAHAQNVNDQSNTATCSIKLKRPVHPAPTNLRATCTQQYEILLEWNIPDQTFDNNSEATKSYAANQQPGVLTHYNIYRNNQPIGTADASQPYFIDYTDDTPVATYHINAQYENGHSDLTTPTTVNVITAIQDIESEWNLQYSIHGRTLTITSLDAITLTDISGRTILDNTSNCQTITKTLPSGLYIIKSDRSYAKIIIK